MHLNKVIAINKKIQLLSFGFIFVLSLRLLGDNDLGFILKGGEWIVENKKFPDFDTYTYTVNDHKYINSHWLFQIIGYSIYNIFGYNAISLIVSVVVLSCFYLTTKKDDNSFFTIFILILASLVINFRFNFRPEIFTWLFLCFYLKVLTNSNNFNTNKQFLLLPIQILWTNSHGLSIIGVFVYLIFIIFEYLKSYKIQKKQISIFILLVFSLLLTPYFIDGALFPFYLFTRLQESNIMNNQISEFTAILEIHTTDTSPFQSIKYNILGFFILFVMFVINFFKKKVPLFIFVIALFFFFLSIRSVRNIPLLIFTIIPYVSFSINNQINSQRIKKTLKFLVGISIILLTILVYNGSFYAITRQEIKFGLGLNANSYPNKIAHYLNKNTQKQNILNDFNTGSWLEWSTKNKVYIDGRLEVMREDFFEEYLASMNPGGLYKLIEKYNSKLLVFDYLSNPGWCKQISLLKDWKKLMIDGKYVLLIREDSVNKKLGLCPAETNPIKFSQYQKDSILEYYLNKNINIITKFKLALEGKIIYNYSSKCAPGIWHLRLKENKLSEDYFIDYLSSSKGIYPEIFVNLGSLYFNDNQKIKAYLCYKKAQLFINNNSIIENRLELLQTDKGIIKLLAN